jgi:predicted TIM-barrel fold metal-dependent hydrolase
LSIFKSFKQDNKNYKHILDYLKDNEKVDLVKGVIVEFNVDEQQENYIIYRIRTDKFRPNGEITVTNTLKNIKESIKISEI